MGQLSFFTYDENTDPNMFKTPSSGELLGDQVDICMIKEQNPKKVIDTLQNALPIELQYIMATYIAP